MSGNGNGQPPTERDLLDVAEAKVQEAGRELANVGARASYFPASVGLALGQAVNALGAAVALLVIRVDVLERRLDAAEAAEDEREEGERF